MNHGIPAFILAASLFASSAQAAPKIDNVTVKPNPAVFAGGKPPEVEVSVSVSRTRFGSEACDARVEFGDGEGRTLDFSGVAGTRTVRHVYKKGGNYRVVAKGSGKNPCEGTRELALNVTGGPAAKKAEKKAEKKAVKKAPAKKDAKKDTKKKDEKKKGEKKKGEKKKDEKKKDEPK